MKKITVIRNLISAFAILTLGLSPFISLADEPPVPSLCQLQLTQTDNPDPVSPGNQLSIP